MEPVVNLTKTNCIIGKKAFCRDDRYCVNAYLGVPYARPPIGHLRFQAPQPIELPNGEWHADNFGPICPQDMELSAKTHFPFPMPELVSEDCLYLNVWTPKSANDSSLKPTMIWIHGGSFLQGFSNCYNGTAFAANHDIVFVSINYRLGPFGFLATGDEVVAGNAGLLDQVAALKWVRTHISKFGGDPENITLLGESAGAISISMHMCSPLAHGLFRRAICQSGTALHPSALWPRENARKYLLKRIKAMGCKDTESNEILSFLNTFSGPELVKHLGIGFVPILDGYYMPDTPTLLYKSLAIKQPVDLLLGFNSHEGAQFIFALAKAKKISSVDHAHEVLAAIIKTFYRNTSKLEDIRQHILKRYLHNVDVTNMDQLTEMLAQVYGDLLFVAPSIKKANIYTDTPGTKQVFLYRYCYRSSISWYPDWVTADHGQEIPLVIGEPNLPNFPDIWSDADKTMSNVLMNYWASFARTGNPNSHGFMHWPVYTRAHPQYIQLDANPSVKTTFPTARLQLWTRIVDGLLSDVKQKSKY